MDRSSATHPNNITVIGAGSWGTALAVLLANNGFDTRLWGIETDEMLAMQNARCNKTYLPDVNFPEKLNAYTELATAIDGVCSVLIAVPSHAFRSALEGLACYFPQLKNIIWASKGLDPKSGNLLHTVFNEIVPAGIHYAVLSGPSFAKEVALGSPTAVSLASPEIEFAETARDFFQSSTFRVHPCTDVIGVQLGAAVKNVLAIATGVSEGLGYGANAQAALITCGLVEMRRLGEAVGASAETLIGLSGLGDLMLTCSDNQSRNRRFGLALGKGGDLERAKQEIKQTIEGIDTAKHIYALAKKHQVEMPICSAVYHLVRGEITTDQAVDKILSC